MNFNGNREYTNFAYEIRTSKNPDALIAEKNIKRMNMVEKAKRFQPIILPLKFTLPLAAQVNPIAKQTPKVNYDVIVLGAISDLPDFGLNVRPITSESPLAFTGTDPVQNAFAHDFAGWGANASADTMNGVFYWHHPYELMKGDRFIVEVFKGTATGTITRNYFAFVGSRIFGADAEEAQFTDAERTLIKTLIEARRIPKMRLLTMPVAFKGGGVAVNETASSRTPEQREPLLIRGARTTLTKSRVTLKFEGQAEWMPEPAPIWALACHENNETEIYNYFEYPIYLPANTSIQADFINTLDDADATFDPNGRVTFLAETV